MSSGSYLIAIALIEQKSGRSMPLGGKSLREPIADDEYPGSVCESIALELLLRVLERSDEEGLYRAAEDNSVLIAEISYETIQASFPNLKKEWLESGDTNNFIDKLINLSMKLWSLNFIKYQGLSFKRLTPGAIEL